MRLFSDFKKENPKFLDKRFGQMLDNGLIQLKLKGLGAINIDLQSIMIAKLYSAYFLVGTLLEEIKETDKSKLVGLLKSYHIHSLDKGPAPHDKDAIQGMQFLKKYQDFF